MVPSRYLNQDKASAQFGPLAEAYAASLSRGDPLADAAVEDLSALPHGRWWTVVLEVLDHGAASVPDAPASLQALLAGLPPAPSEAEWATIEQGAAAVMRTGDSAGLVMQCASLM